MREIWKYSLLLASSVLLQCTDKPKTFLVYEVNPLKDAYAENKVQSYIVYGFSEGRRFTGDSVTLDNSGNIERIISTGIKSERRFTYDSLNRRVHECQHSDIHMDIWTTYEDRPEKQMVIKYISNDGDDDGPGEFNHKETLIFDSSQRQILKEVEVNLSTRDSTATVFDYDGDKLVRSTRSFNGAGGFVTDYFYTDNHLVRIKTTLDDILTEVHYVSQVSGLIDSTYRKERDYDPSTIYYKYYIADNRQLQR